MNDVQYFTGGSTPVPIDSLSPDIRLLAEESERQHRLFERQLLARDMRDLEPKYTEAEARASRLAEIPADIDRHQAELVELAAGLDRAAAALLPVEAELPVAEAELVSVQAAAYLSPTADVTARAEALTREVETHRSNRDQLTKVRAELERRKKSAEGAIGMLERERNALEGLNRRADAAARVVTRLDEVLAAYATAAVSMEGFFEALQKAYGEARASRADHFDLSNPFALNTLPPVDVSWYFGKGRLKEFVEAAGEMAKAIAEAAEHNGNVFRHGYDLEAPGDLIPKWFKTALSSADALREQRRKQAEALAVERYQAEQAEADEREIRRWGGGDRGQGRHHADCRCWKCSAKRGEPVDEPAVKTSGCQCDRCTAAKRAAAGALNGEGANGDGR